MLQVRIVLGGRRLQDLLPEGYSIHSCPGVGNTIEVGEHNVGSIREENGGATITVYEDAFLAAEFVEAFCRLHGGIEFSPVDLSEP